MPIRNIPFRHGHPYLPIRIVNPHTQKSLKTMGLVDTGADECSMPASMAAILGHDLEKGIPKNVHTAGGLATGYGHTTRIEIYDFNDRQLFVIDKVMIDFMPGLHTPLLERKGQA